MKIQTYIMNVDKLNNNMIFEKYLADMPKERQAKVMRIKHRMDKNRSLGAGILLARGLFASRIRIEDAVIEEGIHGKPYLKGVRYGGEIESCEHLYFNLSHAGDYVVAAFGDVPVGIDIERRREYSDRLAKRCLGDEEQIALEGCTNEEEKRDLFLRYWTIKESAAKVSGLGLHIPFSAIRIGEDCRVEVKTSENTWKYYLKEFEICGENDILGMNEIQNRKVGSDKYRIAVCAEHEETGIEPVWEEIQYEEI